MSAEEEKTKKEKLIEFIHSLTNEECGLIILSLNEKLKTSNR